MAGDNFAGRFVILATSGDLQPRTSYLWGLRSIE